MISVLAATLVWLPALVGLGSVLPAPADPALRRGVAGILGIGLLGVVVMVVQLAIPFGPVPSLLCWIAGMALLLARRRALLEGLSGAELVGAALLLGLSLFWYQSPAATYDSGLYYLQATRWTTAQPLRLGLANLHDRLAFNSLWLSAAAGLELPLLSGRSFAFANVLPLVFGGALAGVGLHRTVAGASNFSNAALAFLFPVLGHATGGLGAASPDQAAEVLVFLCFALWIRALAGDDRDFATDAGPALLLAVMAVLVKLSTVPIALAVAVSIVQRRRALSVRWATRVVALAAAAVVPWALRSVLLSGCIAFPVPFTCAPGLPWARPLADVQSTSSWIRSWARAPQQDPSIVLASLDWLPRWAASTWAGADARMWAAAIAAGLVLAAGAWRIGGPARSAERAGLVAALVTCALGLAWVFYTAPDPRFAYGFLQAAGLLPLAFALGSVRPRGRLAVLVLMGAMVFLTLRWARIGHMRGPWRMDPVAFPTPPPANVVERDNGQGTRAFVPVAGDQCWDAPVPCTPALDPSLVESHRQYRVGRAR